MTRALLLVVVGVVLGAPTAAARPCATMAMRALVARGNPLLGVGIGERRTDEVNATLDSATLPLRVHYGDDSPIERAQLLLTALEAAWALQVGGAGFSPPLADEGRGGDDRFDAYLVSLSPGVGARTFAEADADAADGKHASPAFLEMSPVLDDDSVEVFAHHEFQHALQFALDRSEAVGFLESTAVLFEIRARPDVTLWQDAVSAFQHFPQVSPFSTSDAVGALMPIDDPRFEYGAGLLALYLDVEHGDGQGALFAALMSASAQPDADIDNEPDWLDALDDAAGVGAADVVVDFIGWRALVGTLAVPDDGPPIALQNASLLRTGSVLLAALDGEPTTTDDSELGPSQYGCVVRAIQAPDASGISLHVAADAADDTRTLALSTLVTVPDSGVALRTEVPLRGAHVEADLEAPAGALVHIAFCDVTEADVDDALEHHPITYSLLRTDVDWPDAGPEPAPDAGPHEEPPPPDEPDCQCVSADVRTPLSVALVLWLALVLRRRRIAA